MDLLSVLKKHWGYDRFRPPQEEIIRSALSGRDTVALMPTGGGKSICYQLPALVRPGMTLVVSPLISLMRDQVNRLAQMGVPAQALHSGQSFARMDQILNECLRGRCKLLYVAPERLQNDMLLQRVPGMNINLLAVDEAHCVSQWGYDFRPAYLRIAAFRENLPRIPLLALTATATPAVLDDLIEKLHLRHPAVFRTSFLRPNLSYAVLYEEDKPGRLLSMLHKTKGTALVYVRSRQRTQQIARHLAENGITAEAYHAGLMHKVRQQRQQRWMQSSVRVMVCTNAFGMGIDKPDVRLVVHWDLPDNLESYFQEAGRAGRDGKKSHAVLLFNNSDLHDVQQRLQQAVPEPAQIRQVYQALANHFRLALGAGQGCTFPFDLGRFCKTFRLQPMLALNAIKVLEQHEYLLATEAVFLSSSVLLRMKRDDLYRFELENPNLRPLVLALLRSYPGLFEQDVSINEDDLAVALRQTRRQVEEQLRYLHQCGVIAYTPATDEPLITFLQPRHDSRHLPLDVEQLRQRRQRHAESMQAMLRYATRQIECRSTMLLRYFGESDSAPCGICDVCLKRNVLSVSGQKSQEIRQVIRSLLQQKAVPLHEIVHQTTAFQEKETLWIIQQMLDARELRYDAYNRLTLAG
ncbi:MAG: ATP-dependent DNA helicase RecQ [Chitinophagales bacterium]|nr:RecQ family ATP-dependent DNA helicase [Chitinophagales bacterium]MDW8392698.1 ATP-dependent DNA helicase RecQ [Chitinophagales bacterium]